MIEDFLSGTLERSNRMAVTSAPCLGHLGAVPGLQRHAKQRLVPVWVPDRRRIALPRQFQQCPPFHTAGRKEMRELALSMKTDQPDSLAHNGCLRKPIDSAAALPAQSLNASFVRIRQGWRRDGTFASLDGSECHWVPIPAKQDTILSNPQR